MLESAKIVLRMSEQFLINAYSIILNIWRVYDGRLHTRNKRSSRFN